MTFFAPSSFAGKGKAITLPQCGACGLWQGCKSPKMAYTGSADLNILIVGEAPGEMEDEQGRQFVGKAGQCLQQLCDEAGFDLADCWLTNAAICFDGDTEIQSPSPIQIGYRRNYSGPLIKINTLAGRTLTGTPNHPILTPAGWMPLGSLKEGDNLVCRSVTQGAEFGGADVDDPPTKFEKLFNSLAKFGDIKRVVGGSMDFHGDGEDGNIDVVVPNRELRYGVESSGLQHLHDFPFSPPNTGQGLLSVFGRGCSDSVNLIGGSLFASDSGMRRLCQSQSSLPPGLSESEDHCVASVAERNAFIEEQFPQFVLGTLQRDCQGFEGLPFEVSFDRIFKIEVKSSEDSAHRNGAAKRSTHVYNLQTESGYYIAGGIVVSNCRPPGNELKDHQVEYCRPNLLNTIVQLKPKVIVLLGGSAVESLIGSEWGGDIGPMAKWAGYAIPSARHGCWICPTYHPSFIERSKREPLLWKTVRGHLANAFKLAKSPAKPPCYPLDALKAQVEVITDPRQAKHRLRALAGQEGILAFDYETTGLKPERPEQRIVCASFCLNGEETFACLIEPKLHKYLSAVLLNPNLKKVGSNIKFEERWTRQKLGHGVAGWHWDTMLTAHYLDNRPGITSVKFQAYIHFGIGGYAHWVEEEIGAKAYEARDRGANAMNRMDEAHPEDMLTYCALDSLIEYKVMEKQKEAMGAE